MLTYGDGLGKLTLRMEMDWTRRKWEVGVQQLNGNDFLYYYYSILFLFAVGRMIIIDDGVYTLCSDMIRCWRMRETGEGNSAVG